MTPAPFVPDALSGLLVALPTPFTPDHAVDLPALRRLARRSLYGGARALVVLGVPGEAPSLEDAERDAVIQAVLEEAQGRPVVAGTGSCSTRTAVSWTRRARHLGVHAALVVTPYYTRPTQGGLVAHYRAIADAVPGFPLVAGNAPSRTCVNLEPPTLASLWRIPEVVGVVDGSGDLDQLSRIAAELPEGRVLLAGADVLAARSIALGARGLVSDLGSAYPGAVAELVNASLEGRAADAARLQEGIRPLANALFHETNPIPLKALLASLGLCGDQVRLPLLPAAPGTRTVLASAIHRSRVA